MGLEELGSSPRSRRLLKKYHEPTLKLTATHSFRLKRFSQTTKSVEDSGGVSPDMGFRLSELPSLSQGCCLLRGHLDQTQWLHRPHRHGLGTTAAKEKTPQTNKTKNQNNNNNKAKTKS